MMGKVKAVKERCQRKRCAAFARREGNLLWEKVFRDETAALGEGRMLVVCDSRAQTPCVRWAAKRF